MQWRTDFANEYGLSPAQIEACARLLEELESRSDRGLTAVTGRKNLLNVHFRDSLALLAFRELDDIEKIIDIGSGAGFPGLPLAIARPQQHFTLLEANARKSEFIRQTISLLDLDNAVVINCRAEDLARTPERESYGLALARAVGPLAVVLEYCLPLVQVGGHALLQRGDRENGDSTRAGTVAHLLGGELVRVEPVQPFPEAKNLHVWVFGKPEASPSLFPRRAGIPGKRPLSADGK